MSNSTLKERLSTLLHERRSLRALLTRYRNLYVSKRFDDERADLEKQIFEIIKSSLTLSPRDLPAAERLTECAYNLQNAFADGAVVDCPDLVWNGSLAGGFSTQAWPAAVKTRLLDLCGPPDDMLTRMLSE